MKSPDGLEHGKYLTLKRKEQTDDQRHWRKYHRQNCKAPLLQESYNVIKCG